MTLHQLNRLLDQYDPQVYHQEQQQPQLEILKGLPFYCEWDYGRKLDTSQCCLNHVIGLPKRLGQKKPLFEYQHTWYNALQNNRMVYLLKCTGAGATEFMIRYISWLCTKDDQLKGSQIVIATGPRIETSIAIIERMKHLFLDSDLVTEFNTKQTTIELNRIRTIAIPSDHLDTARGIPNVSIFYSDETAFYSNKEQENLRDVAERYIAKSNPQIVLISTPNRPDDIMQRISLEKDSLYHRIYTDYSVCLRDGMFTLEEIELQKKSPSFDREYNLRFLGGVGNIFHPHDIDFITKDEYTLDDSTSELYTSYMGCDPGFGSSEFGIVVVRMKNQKLEVVFADSYERPLYQDTLKLIIQLAQKYHCCKILTDGSNAALCKELKNNYGEFLHYDRLEPEVIDKWILSECNFPKVVPITFRTYHKDMLQRAHKLVSKHKVRVKPSFNKLIVALRTATAKGEWDLDKTSSNSLYTDVLDAFMLSVMPLQFRSSK